VTSVEYALRLSKARSSCYRLDNENVDEKYAVVRKNRESRRRHRQSGLQKTVLHDLKLGVVMKA